MSLARYPLWIKVKSSNFNKKNAVVSEIERLNLLWASSVSIKDYAKEKAEYLFKTSEKSWVQKSNFKLDLDSYKYPVQDGAEQFNLAASYDGEITSFFMGKDIPKNENGSDQFSENKVDSGRTKFIVVGNEQFIQDNFSGNDEFIFLMNAIDWLSKEGSLIEIRNKGKFSRPLDKTKEIGLYNFFKSFIIGFSSYFIPLLIIVIGVVLFILRKIRNKKIQEYYSK